MKRNRFSEEQMISILEQGEAGIAAVGPGKTSMPYQ